MKKDREPLFSLHNHTNGHIALYLEEQDAVMDLLEDIVGAHPIRHLDNLRASAYSNMREESYAYNLDSARSDIGESAPLICNLTETEALILAEDLVRAVKFARIGREIQEFYPELKSK